MILLAACLALTQTTPVGDERIVVRTSMGDVVLALFPDNAPRHATQLLALFRAGVYDGIPFQRIVQGMVVQAADHRHRRLPLTRSQRELMKPLPLEISSLRHRRGVLSMAHEDHDPDTAMTSFSVVIGNAPHLDGRYTIFGRVERGMEVIDAIARLKEPDSERPSMRVDVERAWVVESTRSLDAVEIRAARATPDLSRQRLLSRTLLGLGGGAIAAGFLAWALGARRNRRTLRLGGLMTLLAAFFIFFAGELQSFEAAGAPGEATILLLGSFAIFRVMAGFEPPRPQRDAGSGTRVSR
jgi:cyclophilin family peptidyl-prolyl cis-trans isomerase